MGHTLRQRAPSLTATLAGLLAVTLLGCTGRDPNLDDGIIDIDGGAGVLTNGQVAQVLRTANLVIITQSDVARPRLTTPVARDFADSMREAHTRNNTDLTQLVEDIALDFQESDLSLQLQTDGDSVNSALQGASLRELDRLYLQSQIDVHQTVLLAIDDQLIPDTTDPQLRTFVELSRGMFSGHLQAAQAAQFEVTGATQ
jgi:putative membrane protein